MGGETTLGQTRNLAQVLMLVGLATFLNSKILET